MTRRLLHLLLLLSLAACGDEPVRFVSIAELDHDFVFVISLDEKDRALRVEGPVVLDPERDGKRFTRVEPSESMLIIGFGDEELRALTPLYDPEGYARLALAPNNLEGCRETGRLSRDGEDLELPIPAAWSVYRASANAALGSALFDLSQWAVSVPVDPDACTGPGHDQLVPFASRARPIVAGEMVGSGVAGTSGLVHNDVLRIDETRVLTASGPWVLVFERGQPFINDAKHVWELAIDTNVRALAIDRDPSRGPQPGKLRIVAGGVLKLPEAPADKGLLIELALGDDGIEHIQTSSVSTRVDDVLIDPTNGRLVAASRNGRLFTRATQHSEVEEVRIPDTGDEDGTLAYTGDSTYPYLLGGSSEGNVFLGRGDAREWVPVQDGLGIANYPALAGFVTPEGLELWVSQFTGIVMKRDGAPNSEFRPLPVALPPAFRGCGLIGECGWAVQPNSAARFAALGDSGLLLTMNTCAAVVELRRDGACADFIEFVDRPVETVSDEEGSDEGFREISVTDDFVTIVSRSGDIYEWRRTR